MLVFLVSGALAAPCVPADVAKVVAAIPQVAADQQVPLAGAGLAEACPGAVALAATADKLGQVSPDQRRLIDAQLVLQDPMGWIGACPGGPAALANAMRLAPAEARAALWRDCQLVR